MKDTNFCIRCGARVGPYDEFCTYCGARIADMDSPTPKINTLNDYQEKINALNEKYEIKEKEAHTLIEEHFSPQEITYNKFNGELDKCRVLFYRKYDNAQNIIQLFNDGILEDAIETKNKLNEIIDKMTQITQKVTSLINEFIINSNSNKEDDEEIEDLFKDMDNLIDSVKEYK